ncbi:hypothetical protein MW887_009707 [Aspergillus wentii]|nr:hypothetical protein MW887_009707 [Aspergillus wentii]
MSSLQFPAWAEQSSLFKLPCTDTEPYNQASNTETPLPHLPGNDTERAGSKKMAIPRLAEGPESAFPSPAPWNPGSGQPSSRSSSVGPFEAVDQTEEDFNRDETARATGFIGKSSEIAWLQKLSREINQKYDVWPSSASDITDTGGLPSPTLTPRAEGQTDPCVVSSNYYLDDLEIPAPEQLDAHDVPSRDTATKLFNAYLTSVHPSFPIIGISTFISQFQVFFNQPSLKPGNKWLAILNLIFAVGAKYSHLTDAEWRGDEDDHYLYFSRARALSLDDQLLHHPDLQQLQVEGLASFYLLALGHINRSWILLGGAIRGALALGLHLRNVGTCTSDTSKEIRYRVWWSLYTIEYLLSVVTGRPSCIIDSACSTPLPVPFDESDFQKEEVARQISDAARGSSSQLERITVSSTCSLNSSAESDSNDTATNPKDTDTNKAEYLKGLPPCMSLYFLQLTKLISISKRMTIKLYSPEAAHSPWPSTEFTIQSLVLELDSWFMNLPTPYDFTSTQTSQCPMSQRMSLAFLFYSTKIGITRPCLCRLDMMQQGDREYDSCSKTAAECVESACHMLTLFPDSSDAALLHRISPWWCILHFLMQATTVLLLELAFRTQHVPEKSNMVSKAAKKALEWLSTISQSNMASERAWKLCDGFMRRLASHVGVDISEFTCSSEATTEASPDDQFDAATAANAATADVLAAELDSIICSPMDQSNTPLAAPVSYTLEPSDVLDIMKTEKPLAVRESYDDCLPYDPTTGQITGSFFPEASNLDLDLGYVWNDPIC